MKVKITYSIEVLGQIALDGSEFIPCDSLEDAEKKIKSLRNRDVHGHVIKTIENSKGKKERILID